MAVPRLVVAALVLASAACFSTGDLQGGALPDGGGETSDAATSSDAAASNEGGPGKNDDSGTATDPYVVAVLADAPIGYWRFEEASGLTTKDAMGAHDGTLAGKIGAAKLGAAGAVGNAIAFDGTNGCVAIGGGSTFLFPGGAEFSAEAWIRPSDTSSHDDWILTSELVNPDPYPRYGWSLYTSPTFAGFDQWNQDVDAGSAFIGGAYATYTNTKVPLDAWTYVAFTFDDTHAARIYVNGNLVDKEGTTGLLSAHAGALAIGCRDANYGTMPFVGSIDEVAVYDKALTAMQIATHFEARK